MHKILSIQKNENAEIITEIPIKNDVKIRTNKSDIMVKDFINNKIYLVEIGISSINNFKSMKW